MRGLQFLSSPSCACRLRRLSGACGHQLHARRMVVGVVPAMKAGDRLLSRVTGFLSRVIDAFGRDQIATRDVCALSKLDDRLLDDIGLPRSQAREIDREINRNPAASDDEKKGAEQSMSLPCRFSALGLHSRRSLRRSACHLATYRIPRRGRRGRTQAPVYAVGARGRKAIEPTSTAAR